MASIPRRVPPVGIMGLRKSVLIIGAVVVLVLALSGAWIVHRMLAPKPKAPALPKAPLSDTTTQARKHFLADEPRTYDAIPKPPPKPALPPRGIPLPPAQAATLHAEPPKPERKPEPVQALPVPQGPSPTEIEARIQAAVLAERLKLQEERNRELQAQLAQQRAMQSGQGGQHGQQGQPQGEKKSPPRWFSTASQPQGDTLAPPFNEDAKEKEGEGQPSKLFTKATWEKPANPYKVLYADQIVQGLLMQGIDSDIPGTIRIKVVEAVKDRWGHGHEILPFDTTFIGKQEGQTAYGQTRIPVQIYMGILPNGTAIKWNNGQAGDAEGASGIPAKVNNHLGKLIIGAGISAVLNIGVRAPFGSTSGFQPNLGQEFAQDATQGINQNLQPALRQQFAVRPTLTQAYGYPVTISFLENVSFMTAPGIVKQ